MLILNQHDTRLCRRLNRHDKAKANNPILRLNLLMQLLLCICSGFYITIISFVDMVPISIVVPNIVEEDIVGVVTYLTNYVVAHTHCYNCSYIFINATSIWSIGWTCSYSIKTSSMATIPFISLGIIDHTSSVFPLIPLLSWSMSNATKLSFGVMKVDHAYTNFG